MAKRKIGRSKKIQPVTFKDDTEYKRRQKALVRKPEPAVEIARHLKKTQDEVLKALLPSFFLARAAGQSKGFFERANLVWCLRFPEPEEEIRVKKDYLADHDYKNHVLKMRQKLVRSKLGWISFLCPERAGTQSPPSHSWNAELNSAIQEIMKGLPTPMIGLEELEKAIAGPSLEEISQEETSSEGDFDFNFL